MQVEDIITEWMDDNAADIIRNEIDVEDGIWRQVEEAIEKELDNVDVKEMVQEHTEKTVNLSTWETLEERLDRVERDNATLLKEVARLQELARRSWWQLW